MNIAKERAVYINGRIVPETQAKVSIFDRGLRYGDAVYEVTRTFHGKLFRVGDHIDRLYASLKYCRIDPKMDKTDMIQATEKLVKTNRTFLPPNGDYGVTHVITRGLLTSDVSTREPTIIIYCEPIRFASFARFYVKGIPAVTTPTRRIPPQCLSPKAKIANRMNNIIAEYEAKQIDHEAFPIMLDLNGYVTESSTANFLFVSQGVIKVPNRKNVLNGISMNTLLGLARDLNIAIEEGDYTPFDVYQADEAFITNVTFNLLPLASLDELKIGTTIPGPVTQKVMSALSESVGIDVVQQAMSFLPDNEIHRFKSSAISDDMNYHQPERKLDRT